MEIAPKPKSRRELLAKDITDRVRAGVEEELEIAASLSEEDRNQITAEVVSGTTRILDALSFSEMHNEAALLSHIFAAMADARKLMRERRR
jgi:hypothetical protein